MVAAAADRPAGAGQEIRAWRRLFRTVLEATSLACRYLWGSLRHGRVALDLEAEAEHARLTHSLLLSSMRTEFYAVAGRAGLDLEQTTLDEMLEQMAAVCGRLWRLERCQGREIGATVRDMETARGHAAAANRLMEPALGQGVVLTWAE